MEQTEYFARRVLRQRAYIQLRWCEETVRDPEFAEEQEDGRFRFWRFVPELGNYLRVVTLEDGETLHNAFVDRTFRLPEEP